ncbi:hypothetical protein B4135_4295 [Caldibacillus debilis]|uniref:Uncharacterized protein n=1 Tax=Caldibacillus debilis TaxID=301148 RepID=A0A150L5P2_9BACI|nr:hypothetical protein B4135_4295 [Caldibacillus debilis]
MPIFSWKISFILIFRKGCHYLHCNIWDARRIEEIASFGKIRQKGMPAFRGPIAVR